MEVQCQSLDRISALPEDTIEKILGLMPTRDALRTSILSKKWRYSWTGIPKLVFDHNLVNASSDVEAKINNNKFVKAIFHVLLLHKGPISELHICIPKGVIANEIDQIILHLSQSKHIKKLIFEISSGEYYYRLPCSFFSLQGLEHLSLKICEFPIPLTFNGFSMLKSLIFNEVVITASMLQQFLTSCPLLEEFTLIGDNNRLDYLGGNKCTFVELLKWLPSVQVLNLSKNYIKQLITEDSMPQMLPDTSIVHLNKTCFQEQDELSATLSVISSSPNLEKIKLEMVRYVGETVTPLLDLQHFSNLKLDHLKELEITGFHNYAPEREFVKLIMAKSPLLKIAQIELDESVSVEEEVKMLRDMQFPRASPAAEFVIKRP